MSFPFIFVNAGVVATNPSAVTVPSTSTGSLIGKTVPVDVMLCTLKLLVTSLSVIQLY